MEIMFGVVAGDKTLPASMTQIEHSDHPHRGKPTSLGLPTGLRVSSLVGGGIHELHRAAIKCFESQSVPAVLGTDPTLKLLAELLCDLLQEALMQTQASLPNAGLPSTFGSGKNGARKARQERLIFHTHQPYSDRLLV